MSAELGYVVIEFNQASRQPFVREDVWHDIEDAKDIVEQAREETRKIGRRERYAIGTVYIEEEDE
jgi:hypothetical protein